MESMESSSWVRQHRLIASEEEPKWTSYTETEIQIQKASESKWTAVVEQNS